MHLFHKWGKWSGLKDRGTYNRDIETGITLYSEGIGQERTCSACGKYEWRKV